MRDVTWGSVCVRVRELIFQMCRGIEHVKIRILHSILPITDHLLPVLYATLCQSCIRSTNHEADYSASWVVCSTSSLLAVCSRATVAQVKKPNSKNVHSLCTAVELKTRSNVHVNIPSWLYVLVRTYIQIRIIWIYFGLRVALWWYMWTRGSWLTNIYSTCPFFI